VGTTDDRTFCLLWTRVIRLPYLATYEPSKYAIQCACGEQGFCRRRGSMQIILNVQCVRNYANAVGKVSLLSFQPYYICRLRCSVFIKPPAEEAATCASRLYPTEFGTVLLQLCEQLLPSTDVAMGHVSSTKKIRSTSDPSNENIWLRQWDAQVVLA